MSNFRMTLLLVVLSTALGCSDASTAVDAEAAQKWRSTAPDFSDVIARRCAISQYWSEIPEQRLFLMSVDPVSWADLKADLLEWSRGRAPYWSSDTSRYRAGFDDPRQRPDWWAIDTDGATDAVRLKGAATLDGDAGHEGFKFFYSPKQHRLLVELWND